MCEDHSDQEGVQEPCDDGTFYSAQKMWGSQGGRKTVGAMKTN